MFCWRTSMNKLNKIHEKCLRLVINDYDSNFNELLESFNELSQPINLHQLPQDRSLQIFTWAKSAELMTAIFALRKNLYNIPNINVID